MKSFSNTYIFTFSVIMVTIVAALLAFVATGLKSKQTENIESEKMQNILSSVSIECEKNAVVETFNKYITETYVITPKGDVLDSISVFDVDLKKELAKIEKINSQKELLVEKRISPFRKFISGFFGGEQVDLNQIEKEILALENKRMLPVYFCQHSNGSSYYIFPLQGKGLWGPIWGYVSLESDMNTIFGAIFDHQGETPGLGAEIKEDFFGNSFKGKKIFEEDYSFKSVEVIKPGSAETSAFNVDAISGGTITSKGVEAMLSNNLEAYVTFMENKRN